MLPNGWRHADSTAVEAYRFAADRAALQILFAEGDRVYDYPCSVAVYERFLESASKGRFVNEVLKPYAQARGWVVRSRDWTGW